MYCVCDIILTYTRSTTFNVCQKNIRNVCQNRERCDRRKIYAHNNHSTKFTEFFFISNVISMRAVALLVRVERKWSLFNCRATAIAITFHFWEAIIFKYNNVSNEKRADLKRKDTGLYRTKCTTYWKLWKLPLCSFNNQPLYSIDFNQTFCWCLRLFCSIMNRFHLAMVAIFPCFCHFSHSFLHWCHFSVDTLYWCHFFISFHFFPTLLN